ncbi:MAG: hypothetical protein M9894_30250 [Planctomycetes bacterium]|nr:hypothetical protein [Planctomycetota bacterium]
MRLDALREVVRGGGAEQRAAAIAGLAGEEAARLQPALVALLLVEPSLRVRGAAEEALRRRPPADVAERPAPPSNLSERERVAITTARCHERAFLELMLTTPRGRDLLLEVPLDEAPLDDALVGLCLETDARVVADALALPIDASGRAPTLLRAFGRLPADVREAALGVLVWNALHAARTVAAEEVARARAAVALWVQGLLEPDDGARPSLEDFLAAGGSLERGPTRAAAEPLAPETVAALGDLGRCLRLALDPAARDDAALRAATASAYAELRALGWRLLLEGGHVAPGEALGALAPDEPPGVVVEVLRALPRGGLSPDLGPQVCALLRHRAASVRRAAVEVLADDPLLAALAAAGLDPRAEGAPLEVFAALPEALRAGALAAWLEGPRPPEALARALDLLPAPPPATWAGWPGLLAHEAPRVRAAARRALVRLPASEGEGALRLLEPTAPDDPLTWGRALLRFGVAGHDRTPALARLLLDELAQDAVAEVAVEALARRADARARSILWAFVVGSRRRRFGSRAARARALDALLALPRPQGAGDLDPVVDEVAPDLAPTLRLAPHLQAPRLAARLLEDRDPWQVRLGLRLVEERGANDEVRALVAARVREVVGRLTEGRRWRRLRAGVARLLRGLLPRGWTSPGPLRGAQALAPALLDAGARLGRTGLWAEDARPLLGHPDPAVRAAAARVYGTLPGALPLRDVVRRVAPETGREALRVAHPLQVEAVVLEALARARSGDAPTPDLAGWVAARPLPRLVRPVARFLGDPPSRGGALDALRALHAQPEARAEVEAVAGEVVTTAAASRDDDALTTAAGLVRHLGLWGLVLPLAEGVTWAREAARGEVVAALRAAQEAGVVPAPAALAPLLRHPLWEVRALALSLLRAGGRDAWAAARPAGPAPGTTLPTGFAKPFLGVCEDAWEEAMGLAVEALLAHPNGEVARRALKLLDRRERHVAALALLLRLDDPELRQPALTTFSTWAGATAGPTLGPTLDAVAGSAAARAERLEASRRELRATIEALATAPRAAAEPLVEAALASPAPFARHAALVAIGRLGLVEREADLLAALEDPDPAVARCAAWAAGALVDAAGEQPRRGDVDLALGRLARARDAEVRATARRSLARRLPATPAAPLEAALTDPSPEVRLAVLDAAAERPEVLSALALEARLGDPDPRVRAQVLGALERRLRAGGPPPPAHALRGALGDPQPEVRLAALALARADASGALGEALGPALGEALADPSVHVSGAAIEAMATVTGTAEAGAGAEAEDEPEAEVEAEAGADDDVPVSYGLAEGEEEEDLPASYGLAEGEADDAGSAAGEGGGEDGRG